MPHPKAPRAGDRQLSAAFLRDLDRKTSQAQRIVGAGGMSFGESGVVLPDLRDDPELLKLVYVQYAPGAYGGVADTYGNAPTNDKVLQYKTVIVKGKNDDNGKLHDTRLYRKLFPADGWEYKLQGDELTPLNAPGIVQGNGGVGGIFQPASPSSKRILNPYSYPIPAGGFVWCMPLPNDPDSWMIILPLASPYAKCLRFGWQSTSGNRIELPFDEAGGFSDIKLMCVGRLSDVNTQYASRKQFVTQTLFGSSGDTLADDAVFVNVPGMYEVGWSAEFQLTNTGYKTTEYPFTVSGGATGSIEIERPVPIEVEMGLILNHTGEGPPDEADWVKFGSMRGLVGGVDSPYQGTKTYLVSDPVIRYFNLDTPHGSHYNRLNLAWRARMLHATDGDDMAVACNNANLTIRPTIGDREFMSSGYNPFLGAKTEENPTGFQWWGGGPEPKKFDQDGSVFE